MRTLKKLPARIQQNKCPNIKSATTSAIQKINVWGVNHRRNCCKNIDLLAFIE